MIQFSSISSFCSLSFTPPSLPQAPADELVPGDIIRLKEGDQVPADVRILTVVGFSVEEAILTGTKHTYTPSFSPPFSPFLAQAVSPYFYFSRYFLYRRECGCEQGGGANGLVGRVGRKEGGRK